MSCSLPLGFYSLQIETEPRGALLKPLTQHMAGRRDRAEQRRRVRDADEPGRRAGPPGTGSDPHPTAPEPGHHPQALPTLLPCALPGVGLGWGRVPALAALPALGARGGFFISFWEVGGRTRPHLLSLQEQSSSPRNLGQLVAGYTTARVHNSQGHHKKWGPGTWKVVVEVCKGMGGTGHAGHDLGRTPVPVGWKDSAVTTFGRLKHLPALLTVTHAHHRSSQGGTRAPKAGQRHPPGQQAMKALEPNGKTLFPGNAVFRDRIRQKTARRLSQSSPHAAAAAL